LSKKKKSREQKRRAAKAKHAIFSTAMSGIWVTDDIHLTAGNAAQNIKAKKLDAKECKVGVTCAETLATNVPVVHIGDMLWVVQVRKGGGASCCQMRVEAIVGGKFSRIRLSDGKGRIATIMPDEIRSGITSNYVRNGINLGGFYARDPREALAAFGIVCS